MRVLRNLCEKITHHKFRKCIAWSVGIEPTEYHYRCIICRTRFWNYTPPRNQRCKCNENIHSSN